MPSKLCMWGNSHGVRLPKYIIERTGLKVGDYLYVRPPRQNSCRPDRIDEQGAMMEERIGSIRTGIQ